jgi:signal transduction histidine kinase
MKRTTGAPRQGSMQAFLREVCEVLTSSLDYGATLQAVAQLTVPRLADWCSVYTLTGATEVRLVALAVADRRREQLLRELFERYPATFGPGGSTPVAEVLRTGEPRLVPRYSDVLLESIAADPDHLRLLRAVGARSRMVVPLAARGRRLGALVLGTAESGRHYTCRSLGLAQEVGHLAALAIDNAQLHAQLRESHQQLATALAATQAHAQALEDEKAWRQTFVSVVAHELRSPLTILYGYLQLLQGAGAMPPERQAMVSRLMVEQVGRLRRLVDDLLDWSRLSDGAFTLDRGPTDLVPLVRQVVAEQTVPPDGPALRAELPEGPVVGDWDRQRLAQVLTNLLSNAIKYSPGGGEVVVRVRPAADQVEVSVRDPGVGLTPAEIATLFRPYARSPRTQETRGVGLGLYLARGIVEAHDGRLWAESAGPNQGSEFCFTLPYPPD